MLRNTYSVRRLSWRDLSRYRENLSNSIYRILVSGSRGKTGLVLDIYDILSNRLGDDYTVLGKVTGDMPRFRYMGVEYIIDRGERPKNPFLDWENAGIIASFPANIYVFENQSIRGYTNGVIHRIIKPNIELIPNLRLEHAELGETLEDLARTFSSQFEGLEYVIFGETIPEVFEVTYPILEEAAIKYGVELRVADVPHGYRDVLGIERVYIVQELLDIMGMEPLTQSEYNHLIHHITSRLTPRESPWGFRYIDVAKVNDPMSTEMVYNYVKRNYYGPIYIFAYFRGDRADRTKFFIPFFESLSVDDRVEKVILGGRYYRRVREVLGDKAVEYAAINIEDVFLDISSENGILMFMVNGVHHDVDVVREMVVNPPLRVREKSMGEVSLGGVDSSQDNVRDM